MKDGYINDFKNNFQINMNEKQANIDEFIETIEQRKKTRQELKDLKSRNLSYIIRSVTKKNRTFQLSVVFKAWLVYHSWKQQKHRVATYSRNTVTRGKLKRIYNEWQKYSH
jgi:hypothetical protein